MVEKDIPHDEKNRLGEVLLFLEMLENRRKRGNSE
jgi:hypothetical protein